MEIGDVNKIPVPTKVFQNKNDPFHKREEIQEYYDKLSMKKKIPHDWHYQNYETAIPGKPPFLQATRIGSSHLLKADI